MLGTDWYAPVDAMFTMYAGVLVVLCASTKHRARATREFMLSCMSSASRVQSTSSKRRKYPKPALLMRMSIGPLAVAAAHSARANAG